MKIATVKEGYERKKREAKAAKEFGESSSSNWAVIFLMPMTCLMPDVLTPSTIRRDNAFSKQVIFIHWSGHVAEHMHNAYCNGHN